MRNREPETGVIFVRHGQADYAPKRLYCDDREDPGLTPAGVEQAAAAARRLADQPIAAIYASPMQRTRLTAARIAEATGHEVRLHAGLRERPFGLWDGLYFEEIAERFPDDFRRWKADPVHFVPEGGEPISDHHERVTEALAEVMAGHEGDLIAVVAHVGPIRMCLADALTMPLEAYRRLTIDYGSLSRVNYGPTQHNLVYMNLHDGGPARRSH